MKTKLKQWLFLFSFEYNSNITIPTIIAPHITFAY